MEISWNIILQSAGYLDPLTDIYQLLQTVRTSFEDLSKTFDIFWYHGSSKLGDFTNAFTITGHFGELSETKKAAHDVDDR